MQHSGTLEIPLGTTADERLFALINCAVAAFGASFAFFALNHRGANDAWDQLSFFLPLCFSSLFAIFGLIVVPRCLLAPRPLILSWDVSGLTFDSGRPGLLYLSNRFEHRPKVVYSAVFYKRVIYRITTQDLTNGACAIVLPNNSLAVTVICSGSQIDFGWAAPYHERLVLRETIKSWLKMSVTKR